MAERWSNQLESDPGWGKSAFSGSEEITPLRNRVLRNKLVANGLICTANGNVYIFLTTINTWSVMCSKPSIVFLNSLMSMENASVKYGDAFTPYVEFLERESSDRIANKIPQSICIGTMRLRVALVQGGLKLTECESLLPFIGSDKALLSRLCFMSLAIRTWPRTWKRSTDYAMYKFLAPLFVDPAELRTIEWAIGHALLDPHSYSKAVILYGEGGHGKSTFLALLNIALMGCCGTIPDNALVSLSKGMTQDVASIVVSNRIVTGGDVGGMDENTNLSVIKTLTGHDYVSIPPSRAKTACTLFYASNRLDDPRVNAEWATPAIMRRVVVILMNAAIKEDFDDTIPQDPVSKLDFALRCVHTRLSSPHMPVSPMSVLLTVMGSLYTQVSSLLVPTTDDDIDNEETIIAGNIVAGAMAISTEKVGLLARRISPSCVREIESFFYIKNIAPSNKYFSLHGY